MDFILFYSQFSNASRKLIEEYPSLTEKSVSVDSSQIRNIIKNMSIVCVPTLLLHNNGKIVERIIGYEDIVSWITIYLYNTQKFTQNQLMEDESINIPQQVSSNINQNFQSQQSSQEEFIDDENPQISQNSQQQTSLDDLVLEDRDESDYHITRSGSGNGSLLKVAEEMKKERDNSETLRKRI